MSFDRINRISRFKRRQEIWGEENLVENSDQNQAKRKVDRGR
jgi:hypothetical protein